MLFNYLLLFAIIAFTIFLTVRWKKLTLAAACTGGLIGMLLYEAAGFTAIAMMAAFFILGTAATSWKAATKAALGIAEDNQGRRTALQVLANAGTAAILAIYILLLPEKTALLQVMMAASFSAAAGDTLSSELGNVYGTRYFNIITFKKDLRGLNGVVSLEGTLAGILGSTVIAAIYSVGFGWNNSFIWILAGGIAGNLADSVMGATLERSRQLDNDMVNFINTATGALTVLAISFL
jgi:uncharacterized protein (TIGR00297 family)